MMDVGSTEMEIEVGNPVRHYQENHDPSCDERQDEREEDHLGDETHRQRPVCGAGKVRHVAVWEMRRLTDRA
jgi:hypothetical protein